MTEFVVVCDEYQTKPFPNRESAERRRDDIERFRQCYLEHRVEEVRRP